MIFVGKMYKIEQLYPNSELFQAFFNITQTAQKKPGTCFHTFLTVITVPFPQESRKNPCFTKRFGF